MLTRCPYCQTQFRVLGEQLRLRQGQVRCGACRTVFSALDSLVDETALHPPVEVPAASRTETAPQAEPEAEAPLDAAAPIEMVAPAEALPGESPESQHPHDGTAAPDPAPETVDLVLDFTAPADNEAVADVVADALPADADVNAIDTATPLDAPVDPVDAAALAADAVDDQPVPVEAVSAIPDTPDAPQDSVPAPVTRRRWPWAVGAASLLLLAVGQLLYVFRAELAVITPALRPLLESGCETIGCVIDRPRKPELIGIEASDLAPEGTGLLLTATLKNRAPFTQDFPHLELTLTDTRDQTLVRKVLAPADYLPADRTVEAGFVAQGETDVRLAFALDGLNAVGYRLYLFYP